MTRKRNNKGLYTLLTLLLLVVTVTGGRGILSAFADTTGYTTPLADLQKDSSFNADKYPDNENDCSIQVIQIAESVNGELFLYTYQPCQKTRYLVASQINMALTDKMGGVIDPDMEILDEDKPHLYDLTLAKSDGVFVKYTVNDFKVSADSVRYYNITSIYRPFIDGVDELTNNDNVINSKYFKVGKLFTAETVNGSVNYYCKDIDTVEIIDPYVDFMTYSNGWGWAEFLGLAPNSYTDVHYIAFSTDKKIDTLKEADVKYTTQTYRKHTFDGDSFGTPSDPKYKTLTREMDGATPDNGWFATPYTWKCIQTTQDFIKSTGIDSGNYVYENIKDTEFVLVFLTTPYTQKEVYSLMQGHGYERNGTKVFNVTVLRLMFETNGKTYNLGALMDQIEGDDIPGNGVKPLVFWAYIWRCIVRLFNGTATLTERIVAVVAIFIVVLALPILLTVLSFAFPTFGSVMKTILTGLWTGIKYLFIGLWYVISSPVRLIIWIVHKARGE